MSEYKIGDFANYLGVTPDLLKHYEKFNIIQGVKDEQTNYRYYSFWQSSNILYSKMYQNMGFTLKEIAHLIGEATTEELFLELNTKSNLMSESLKKQDYILTSINELIAYEKEIKDDNFNGVWEIKNIDDFYFLPHSENCKYSEVLISSVEVQQWINLLPVTNLCTKIGFQDGKEESIYFGLSVDSKCAKSFDFDLSSPIERVVGNKVLIYKSRQVAIKSDPLKLSDRILKDPLELIEKHSFNINGDIYIKTLFQTIEGSEHVLYRLIYIPIQ